VAHTRPPAVAGTFYPADPVELERAVAGYLADAASRALAGEAAGAGSRTDPGPAKALIAPHAGYVYSGPVAGSAYAALTGDADSVERVVLLGPAHRVSLRGLAVPTASAFGTPLGDVPVDLDAVEALRALPQVHEDDAAHAAEHSLEVHLPFLQLLLGAFRLVPLVVGDATADQVAEVLEHVWGGPETRVVVSSDLSHYHDYATARRLDAATARAIEELDPEGLDRESACGRAPIRGLLVAARRQGLRARSLDLRSSGDTAGPRGEVVGYGAFALA